MKNKINILLGLGIFLLSLGACEVKSQKDQSSEQVAVQNVDSDTFLKLISEGDGILIDVRTEEEMSNGVIGDPVKIDFSDKDFYQELDQLPKDTEIYFYCAVGGRSGKAAEYLISKGYQNVYNLKGGYDEWVKNGYPKN
ncbi:rhodanese-like domain-containing protein [Mongoliibacter ruber]|uniref:Rhodanese-related sulfurtransferase n=1 Tax=Mongoliibacter ruber TaxID=1750599 RepID=A0A2T0WLB3_9BACT|nr:rhodanese-like domain-containing protein [Mongoliibacter ruber]PRY87486.1 rhodanese-related sulfurtransferase [Mongoliibacter ruber]